MLNLLDTTVHPQTSTEDSPGELDTKSKILHAAIQEFSKRGYSGASLRQITTLANVKHGLVKYHFQSKDGLWRACIVYVFEQFKKTSWLANNQWEGMSMREKTEHVLRSYVELLGKNPRLTKLIENEGMNDNERLDWLSQNFLIPHIERAIEWIKKGQDAGVYPANLPAMNIFYALLGALRNIFFNAAQVHKVFGVDVLSDQEIKHQQDTIVHLFLR